MNDFVTKEVILSTSEKLISSTGDVLSTDSKEKVFAKWWHKKTTRDKFNKYFALSYNNNLYDPLGTDSHRQSQLDLTLKEVSQQTFDHYCKYLKTRNKLHLTQAQRSFING